MARQQPLRGGDDRIACRIDVERGLVVQQRALEGAAGRQPFDRRAGRGAGGPQVLGETLAPFYSCKLAWQSHAFHDISTSNDATPLWLPQLTMAIGTVVLAIAFVDELVLELRGQRVAVTSDEASRNE